MSKQGTKQHREDPLELARENGGHWGEHGLYPVDDWRHEVKNDDTRLGYWEWVAKKIDEKYND